jgi:hypothetical protein
MPNVGASLSDNHADQRRHVMIDAINAQSNVLSERELDCVSGGIKGALGGVCRKDEVASGQNDQAQMFQQILQQLTQGQ